MLNDNENPSEIPETLEPAETDPVSPYSCLNSKKTPRRRDPSARLLPVATTLKTKTGRPPSQLNLRHRPQRRQRNPPGPLLRNPRFRQRNRQRVGVQSHRSTMQHGASHPADDFPGRVVGESGVGSGRSAGVGEGVVSA